MTTNLLDRHVPVSNLILKRDYPEVKKIALKKEVHAYISLIHKIYSNPHKFQDFVELYNQYHNSDVMNHIVFYHTKWRLFESPPARRTIKIKELYIENQELVEMELAKKYYDNVSGFTSEYFTNNITDINNIKLDDLNPIFIFRIPSHFVDEIDLELKENNYINNLLKENPSAGGIIEGKFSKKKYIIRDGWKRFYLAKVRQLKSIQALDFDYYDLGNRDLIYIVHEKLYEMAKKI